MRLVVKTYIVGLLASKFIYRLLSARVPHNQAIVLMYHSVADDADDIDSWTVVRCGNFMRQVDLLRRSHDVVSLDEALGRIYTQESFDRPIAVLTFDDGHSGLAEVLLPVLEREQIPVTAYIATGHVLSGRAFWFDRVINALQLTRPLDIDLHREGLATYRIDPLSREGAWPAIRQVLDDLKTLDGEPREAAADRIVALAGDARRRDCRRIRPLSVDELRALGACRQVTIGAHTHAHEILTRISVEQARSSIVRSRQLLQEWTGRTISHFAYPSGACSPQLMRLVKELGFSSAAGSRAAPWTRRWSRYEIPRIAVGRYDTPEQFRLSLIGGLRRILGLRAR